MKHKLPYRLVGGKSLLKYTALKDCLAYLALAVHPSSDMVALDRVINTPSRKLGPVSQGQLNAIATMQGTTLNQLLLEDLEAWDGPPPATPAEMPLPPSLAEVKGVASATLSGVRALRHTICCMRAACMSDMPLGQPLRELLRCTDYLEHARAVATQAAKGRRSTGMSPAALMEERIRMLLDKMDGSDCAFDEGALPALVRRGGGCCFGVACTRCGRLLIDQGVVAHVPIACVCCLHTKGSQPVDTRRLELFLTMLSLYDDTKEDAAQDVITISTIHGAKGLEWDVVFVSGAW